jgi:hypothetical protein
MGLMLLVRQKYVQQTTSSWASCLWGSGSCWKAKNTQNRQVLITSEQHWLKQGVEQFALRSTNLWILFGIRRNCPRSGRSQIYLFVRRVTKQIVVIIEDYQFCWLHTNFNQHPAVKANSIRRGNYWGSSMWILM